MAFRPNCPQPSNCLIHCFSEAGRFVVNEKLFPIRFASNVAYVNVLRNGTVTSIPLVFFFARYLYEEKTKHERIAECVVTEAIIDLPHCYNNEHHRWILNSAAAIIGVRISEFLDRPIFAALSYSPFPPHVRNVLVFEFGSGGLCSSLLEVQRGNLGITVVASHRSYGCPLVELMGEEMEDKFGIEIKESGAELFSVNAACDLAKNALCSGQPRAVVNLSFLQGKYGVQISPQVFDLAQVTQLNLHWIGENITQCLLQVEEDPMNAVDEVILVGDSVGIPDVKRMLEFLFPWRQLRDELDPGTFIRELALDMAASCDDETMVVSADYIERFWSWL
ncbi:hypothetical protein HPP92_015614 [Vanilla planifolia]|uniref:Uncharacterized protein n=1 Tax=Vanilla planifolia TaxID=51239 RepID=A0A835QTX8_VANPL|nr:hypothetical protein HPP92_015614 [Vanilla planifolia]